MSERSETHILLVEDNPDFAQLVELFLRRHQGTNFIVHWSPDGVAALKELGEHPEIDLILMDYFLPGRNGLEVTRAIRERGITVPVVFLTVNKDFDLAVEVLETGC